MSWSAGPMPPRWPGGCCKRAMAPNLRHSPGRRPPRGAAVCGDRGEAWQDPRKLVARLRQWEKEYDGVLCYRTTKMTEWLEGVLEDHELDWVEVRKSAQAPAQGSLLDPGG